MCELNLWGIETANCLARALFPDECELNLWGIETRLDELVAESFCLCVNWTCEGLKPWYNLFTI